MSLLAVIVVGIFVWMLYDLFNRPKQDNPNIVIKTFRFDRNGNQHLIRQKNVYKKR